MLNKLKAILLLLCITIYANDIYAYTTNYRISQNGGPIDVQFSKILDEIQSIPGTQIINIRLDKGYYSVKKPISINCLSHQIIITGDKYKPTIIFGSIEIDGWELLPNGLWRTRLPDGLGNKYFPDQLFVDGVRAKRSRTPNEGFFVLNDAQKEGTIYEATLSNNEILKVGVVSKDDKPLLTIYRKWTASKRFLDHLKDSTLYFYGKDFPDFNKFTKGNGVVVENYIGAIDQPGEWSVDKKGYIYYLPQKNDVLGVTSFRIPISEKLFVINASRGSKGSVSFNNIIFEHTYQQIPQDGVEFIQSASSLSAAIEVDDIDKFSVSNCEIRNIANYGIWIRNNCTEASIIHNFFHDLGGGALKIGTDPVVNPDELTKHIRIDNNIIYNYGTLNEGAVGIILFNASNCRIVHNDISKGNYTGISVGWVWGYGNSYSKNNEVAYNRISNIGSESLNDLGGIYTLGKSEGTSIHHNVISHVISRDFRGWGIYADEGTSGILVEKNLVYGCTSGGFHQNYGKDNVVRNNIFAWGEKSQFTLSSAEDDNPLRFEQNIIIMETGALFSGDGVGSSKFKIGKNCYWSISSELPSIKTRTVLYWIEKRDSTSVYQDPCFRNPQKTDFRFKNKSITKVIDFEPFDYSKAGVYGSGKWKRVAKRNR